MGVGWMCGVVVVEVEGLGGPVTDELIWAWIP